MTILPFRVSSYAFSIYIGGTYRLTERDGFTGVAEGYYTPVEQLAATKYSRKQIDNAYANGFINEQEYNETIAFIPVEPGTMEML